MPPLLPIFKKAYWSLVIVGSIYALFLSALTVPLIQRHALYAYKLHTGYWDDLNQPEALGFGKYQVNSFFLDTPDGEELYGWHVLPLVVYAAHEEDLTKAAATNSTKELALKLIQDDPESRVVINFHGNAGHVAQGNRPATYRSLTSASSKIHVMTIDYRGFGLSTGIPNEMGLITDGIALVNYVLSLGIPASRIVIVGQSLGTAVASAVGLHFADPQKALDLLPETHEAKYSPAWYHQNGHQVDFAAIILIASFSSLQQLLLTYRIAGFVPILSPLRSYSKLRSWLLSCLQDQWETSTRLVALTKVASLPGRSLRLHIMHARNDWEIPWLSGDENFKAAESALDLESSEGQGVSFTGTVETTRRKEVSLGEEERVQLILEIVKYGGHNRIVSGVPVAIAVLKAFGLLT